jgi:hypothetical protein
MNIAKIIAVVCASVMCGEEKYPNPGPEVHDILSTECFSAVTRRHALANLRTQQAEASVWWQSGFIRQNGKWVTLEKAIQETQRAPLQRDYERLAKTETPEALAKWSLKNNETDRLRALVLANTPRNKLDSRTLRQIGWVEIDGQWIPPEVAYDLAKRRRLVRKSIANWGDEILKTREGLAGLRRQAQVAEKLISEIDSPDAVHAIDQILGSGDPRCQRLAAQTLARIPSAESTQILARYAVFNPLESVRKTSTQALAKRPLESFVPGVLGLLKRVRIDVQNETSIPLIHDPSLPWYDQDWLKAYRQGIRFQTVVETSTELRVHNTDLSALFLHTGRQTEIAMGSHNADFRLHGKFITKAGRRKLQKLAALYSLTCNAVETFNEQNRGMHERAIAVLTAVSDKESDDPAFWWNWWNQYTDVDASQKTLVEVEEKQTVVTFIIAWSCFAAGTPVLTETGPRSIERLRVGDRVASQDIDTGELSFRVVQKTTERPPRATRTINFSNEAIRCTGGHNFWKAGAGWVKARDLKVGDRIRTPTGTEAVTAVAEAKPAKTYNLVVEGFHTYFVGDSNLLVQDLMPIRPTDNVLPGLSRFEVSATTDEDRE